MQKPESEVFLQDPYSRRKFIGAALGGLLVTGAGSLQAQEPDKKEEHEEEEVAPAEDLMREHGVLNRILLIYDEATRRLRGAKPDLPLDVISSASGIVRSFIEDYHEKLEEDYLFPRFRKAGKQTELVAILLKQHQAGRTVTDQITSLAKQQSTLSDEAARHKLADTLVAFNRMYRPHEAREDTVLFPAFKDIVSPHEYAALGEDFEKKEHQLFGEDGFHGMVDRVAGLEKRIGIYDLAQFTPQT